MDHPKSSPPSSSDSGNRREKAADAVRSLVQALLNLPVTPADVAYALGFVGTELGLVVAKRTNSAHVPVLAGLLAATMASATNAAGKPSSSEETKAMERPLRSRLH
jgi:hypothetical protein